MFIRLKKKSNTRVSIQIVENFRDKGKIKQRILRHLGVAHNDEEIDALKNVGNLIIAQIENERQPKLFPPEKMVEFNKNNKTQEQLPVNLINIRNEGNTIVGIHDIYGKVFDELGYSTILKNPARKKHAQKIIKELVLARIARPNSKRSTVEYLEADFGTHLNLDSVYRALDKIDDGTIEKIQSANLAVVRTLFKDNIDIVFFDCTTLYFESFDDDALRKSGYSKDHKFNQPQVVLALAVTKEGLPIGYEIFPGNTYEGHTLIPVINKLKEKFPVDKVIFVADSGLLNKTNLNFFKKNNFYYIVGGRIRNQKKELKNKILNIENYLPIFNNGDLKVATFQQENGDNLVVTYSLKRSLKDAYDRSVAIESLSKKLEKTKNPASYLSNFGYKKYLNVKGNNIITINEEKVNEEKKWDGLHGVATNVDWMKPADIMSYYKGLWQVEESFRINKSDLKIRPIFHWKEQRVKAHLALCFMAFSCVRHLQYRVKTQYKQISPEVIRKELLHVHVTLLQDKSNKAEYALPSKRGLIAEKIYKLMNVPYSLTPVKIK